MEVLFVFIIISLLYKGFIPKKDDAPIALNNPHLNVPKKFSLSPKVWLKDLWQSLTTFPKSNKSYGSAELLDSKALSKILKKTNDGVIIDGKNAISLQESQGICVVGASGSGKSTAYLFTNILQANGSSSLFITDPSKELISCANRLLELGYMIKLLSLENGSSLTYNPLFRCTDSKSIQQTATILVESASESKGGENQFWNSGAIAILSCIIKALQKHPEYYDLNNVRYLLNKYNPTNQNKVLNHFMAENLEPKDWHEWEGILAQDPKVLSGFMSTCKASLNFLQDEHLARLTSGKDTLNLKEIRRTKTAFFLQFPEDQTSYYAPIIKLLYIQLNQMLMSTGRGNEYNRHVHLFLEEFANIGKIPDIGKIFTTIRKRNCCISIIIQALEQISALYGKDAETILSGGIRTKLFLSGLSDATCTTLSKIIGQTTIQQNDTGHLHSRAVLTPDEIRLLDKDQAIFLHHNNKPAIIKIKRYFEDKSLAQMVDKNYQYNSDTPLPPLKFIPLDQETLPSSTPSQKPKPPIKNKKKDKPDPNDDIVFDL